MDIRGHEFSATLILFYFIFWEEGGGQSACIYIKKEEATIRHVVSFSLLVLVVFYSNIGIK